MKSQINKMEAVAFMTTLRMRFGRINHKSDLASLQLFLQKLINGVKSDDYVHQFNFHFPTFKRLLNKYFQEFITDLQFQQSEIINLIEIKYPNAVAKMQQLESEGWTEDKFRTFEIDFEKRVFNSSKKGAKSKTWYKDGKEFIARVKNIQNIIDRYNEYML